MGGHARAHEVAVSGGRASAVQITAAYGNVCRACRTESVRMRIVWVWSFVGGAVFGLACWALRAQAQL